MYNNDHRSLNCNRDQAVDNQRYQVHVDEAIPNLRNVYKSAQIKQAFTVTRVSRSTASVSNAKKQRQISFDIR